MIKLGRNHPPGLIMNQTKLIVRFGVALLLLAGPFATVASAAPSKADSEQTPAKTVTVRGVVYDDQGEPLPGASVMVKGTTQGTVTDLDGNYSINVRPGQTLVVSFIGMKDQEIPVDGRTSINTALDSQATTLDDVVVVGYGSIKKANLTGAVDAVGTEMFENRPVSNVDQMLLGNLPSVNIALTDGAPYRTSYGYNIRGDKHNLGEVNLPNDFNTLTLIDGVEGDPNLINPNDIESVSVLKDAAATAIYGTRGAYGVILITTKNPQETGKVTVNYSTNFNFLTPRAMPDILTDGEQYASIIAEAKRNYRGSENNTANIQIASGKAQDVADEYKESAGITTTTKAGQYRYHGHTNWYDQIYKDYTTSQVHNLSINGSHGKTSYLVSGRIYDYDGIYVGKSDPYKTFNIRSKVGIQVFPWLKISENMDFTHDRLDYGVSTKADGYSLVSPDFILYTLGAPTWEVYNPDGSFTKAGAAILGGLIGDTAGRLRKNKITNNFGTQTRAEAGFFDNTLRFTAEYAYRTKSNAVEQVAVSPWNSQTEGVIAPLVTDKNKQKQGVKRQFKDNIYQTVNAWGEYENTFDKFYLKAMAGFNYDKRDFRHVEYRKRGLSWDDAISSNAIAFAKGENGDGLLDEHHFEDKHWRMAGVFGRINLGWDDRYLLELNARYDGSSVFAAGHQWGFFPSASAGWRVSQEPWWKIDPRWISALKFRVSYGEVGDSIAASAYSFEETLTTEIETDRVFNGQTSYTHLVYPNEVYSAYTWSTVRKFDAGVDVAFFNNKLDISYDYFINRNINQLTSAQSHSDTYGSPSGKANCGAMSTYGWELAVHYNTRFMAAGRPFHIGARAAVGHNHTVIDQYFGNEGMDIYAYYPGQVDGEIWGYKSNGLFQNQNDIDNAFGAGKPYKATSDLKQHNVNPAVRPGDIWLLDLNGDGEVNFGSNSLLIDEETGKPKYGDLSIIGNKRPLLQFSFGFDLDWYNWFLSVGFQGVYKQNWAPAGEHLMWKQFTHAYGPMTKFFANNYWTEDRPDAFFPGLSLGNQIIANHKYTAGSYGAEFVVDRYLFDIGYINLQNVQLGYNIPKKVLQKINVENAKIYFSGENLWNWSPLYKKIGRDFDVTTISYLGDDYEFGLNWREDYGGFRYPKLRTYSIGLNITFGGRVKSAAAPVAAGVSASALAAANSAAAAAEAAAAKAKAEADALRDELAKALKDKEDCEAAKKPMAVRRAEALHLEDIYFELNQSVIRDSEAYKVDNLVKAMKTYPTAHVSITGYADQATGTDKRNYELTKERAEVVAEALKAAGISPARITTEFYGTEKDSSFTPENNRLAVCIVK
jgi:TonB-linked SusC/RagA family outer membrane protein